MCQATSLFTDTKSSPFFTYAIDLNRNRIGPNIRPKPQQYTHYIDIRALTATGDLNYTYSLTYGGDGRTCGGWGQLNISPAWDHNCPTTARANVTVKKTGPTTAEASVDYPFPAGASARSIVMAASAWADAKGRTYDGQTIHEWPVGDPALDTPGPHTVTFTTPSSSRQVVVAAEVKYHDDVQVCQADAYGYGAVAAPVTAGGVSLVDGNMRVAALDPLPPIAGSGLVRKYDSSHGEDGFFGRGWFTVFDQRLGWEDMTGFVHLITADDTFVSFAGNGDEVWPEGLAVPDELRYDSNSSEITYRQAGSKTETLFDWNTGRFIGLHDTVSGRRMTVTPTIGGEATLTGWTIADSLSGITWVATISDNLVRSITATSGLTWTYEYDPDRNLKRVAGPGDKTWRTYEYYTGLMTAVRDGAGKLLESRQYDAMGRVISSTSPLEDIASITYDMAGPTPDTSIARVTPSSGAATDVTIQKIGGAFRPVDHDGACRTCGARNEVRALDDRGRVLRRQDAAGYVTLYTYTGDYLQQTTSAMRPSGCDPAASPTNCKLTSTALATATLSPTSATLTTTYEYTDIVWQDRPTKITTGSVFNPSSYRQETLSYDGWTGQTVMHQVTGWTGDPQVQQTHTATAVLYDGESEGPAFDLDASFPTEPQPRLPKVIDGPRTDVTDTTTLVYYPYDPSVSEGSRGRVAAIKNALGQITKFEDYDLFGTPRRIIDPNGVVTETTTDAIGRVLTQKIDGVPGCDTVADPLCATDVTTTLTYDNFGPLMKEERPDGGVTTFEYDSRGRLIKASRGPSATDLREQVETVYNTAGQTSAHRYLASGPTWVEKRRDDYTYDTDGQLARITHPDTTFVAYTYDKAGRAKTVQDENHNGPNTTYLYDPSGRLRSVIQKLGMGVVTATYAYDADGNLISVTDPNGNLTTYVFDDFGEMLKETSPVSGVTKRSYGLAGELLETADARGASTKRTYDALNRLLSSLSSTPGPTMRRHLRL